ncbi:sterol 26-hydroxylase, mitochondrial [Betta splendens]|uniref:Sterol 26-hydroxylase, mitochondrial n=1 Tax=Betta splendens TaxID=158456 RepID=A0A6P7LDF0_BETSP|nr:sterol 26-hydroxylase, mitochondrial [Betta splendens]
MAVWLCQSALKRRGMWLWPHRVFATRAFSTEMGHTFASQDQPRPMDDLPHASSVKLLYRLLFQGFYNRTHELQIYQKQQYGPIYRDRVNGVVINSPQHLEELLRNEDKFPSRGDMSIWKDYRDMRGFGDGPFTVEGEQWYKLRSVLNKRMLHPRDAADYSGVISAVVTDFVDRIVYLRQCSPRADLVTDLANELYRFSLEGIASILFETRLGCLEKEIPAGTQDFIAAIAQMFSNVLAVLLMPKWSRSVLPHWKRYIAGWDGIFSYAKQLIDKKLEVIQQRVDTGQEVEGEYLTYLLSNPQMSVNDVYGSVTELLLAGVDTTSNSLTWTFYLLSKNPQCQDKLYEEVSTLVPADRMPSAQEVVRMPYLRAVVKESLRMYPVVSMNARLISSKEVSVGGYRFSKNTPFSLFHYAISHDEDTFQEPFTFRPERWLRDGCDRPNAFGSIPFGYGVRGCVGRRIAELEMYMLLFRLIRMFEIKPDPTGGDLKCISRTVLIPDKPLNLRFVDRQRENSA